MIDLTPLQKLPKNVGDLGKLIVARGFKKLPKSNKLPNLVTLPPQPPSDQQTTHHMNGFVCASILSIVQPSA